MFWKVINVAPNERKIVFIDNKLHTVLTAGVYRFLSIGKSIDVFTNNNNSLLVSWTEAKTVFRTEPSKANKFWTEVESRAGEVSLVWHPLLPPQVVLSEDSQVFWKTEDNSELHIERFPKNTYWLPEAVQKSLLQQSHPLKAPLHKVAVQAHERLLITVNGAPDRILTAGEYVLLLSPGVDIRYADTRYPCFDDELAQQWASFAPDAFEVVKTNENELVLWSLKQKVVDVIQPNNMRFFWKNATNPYELTRVSLDNLQIEPSIAQKLLSSDYQKNSTLKQIVKDIEVPAQHIAMLLVDNVQQTILSQGRYFYWQIFHKIEQKIIDLRLQSLEVSGQELLTADKVTVRVNLFCHWQITDPEQWIAHYSDGEEYLYRELQFVIRAIIGNKTMDELLGDKTSIDQSLLALMQEKALQGIRIESMGIRDIILPGEIRQLLTKVVEAEKNALANNIRRREETAATRSLLNTAKVMEENPTALRLKELETLEKVTEKIDKISVFGGLEGILNGLVNINSGAKK